MPTSRSQSWGYGQPPSIHPPPHQWPDWVTAELTSLKMAVYDLHGRLSAMEALRHGPAPHQAPPSPATDPGHHAEPPPHRITWAERKAAIKDIAVAGAWIGTVVLPVLHSTGLLPEQLVKVLAALFQALASGGPSSGHGPAS